MKRPRPSDQAEPEAPDVHQAKPEALDAGVLVEALDGLAVNPAARAGDLVTIHAG